MVIVKTDIFPLPFFKKNSFLLLPHFKPAAASGQAVEFRECHGFYIHIYYILTFTHNE